MAKILSRHSTRDLPYKFPEQIYYYKSQKQQRKAEIEYARKYKDKEWQEDQDEGTGGLQIHTHKNKQAIGQKQENIDETNQLLIQSFQCRWNKEWRGDQSSVITPKP